MRSLRLTLALLVLAPAAARADAVTLKNGVRLEGVIVEETPADLTLQVAQDGTAVLDRALIVVVERETALADEKYFARWAEEAAAERREAAAARAFAARQRAKGLIDFDGEWLTKAEVDARLRRRKIDADFAAAAAAHPPPVVVTVVAPPPSSDDSGLTYFVGPAVAAPFAGPFALHRRRSCRERPDILDGNRLSRFNPVAPLGGIPSDWRFRSSDANRLLFGPNSGAR